MTDTTHPTNPTAEALLSEPLTIPLNDGTSAQLRYDFLALLHIEQEFGSLGALLDKVKDLDDDTSRNAPMLGLTVDLIRVGWCDEHGNVSDPPPPRTAVARKLDVKQLELYLARAMKALNVAFGPEAPADKLRDKDSLPESPDPTVPSRGSSGGESPPDTASTIPATFGGSGA